MLSGPYRASLGKAWCVVRSLHPPISVPMAFPSNRHGYHAHAGKAKLDNEGMSHLVFGGAPAQGVSPDVSLLQASIHLLNLPQGDHNLSQEVVSAHVALAVDGDLQQAHILARTELNMSYVKVSVSAHPYS